MSQFIRTLSAMAAICAGLATFMATKDAWIGIAVVCGVMAVVVSNDRED